MFQMQRGPAILALFLLLGACGGSGKSEVDLAPPPQGGNAWDLPEQAPAAPAAIESSAPALATVNAADSRFHGAIPGVVLHYANLFMAREAFYIGYNYAERIVENGMYGGRLNIQYRSDAAGTGYAILDYTDYRPSPDLLVNGRVVVDVKGNARPQDFVQVTSFHDYREEYADGHLYVTGTVTQPGRLAHAGLQGCCKFSSVQTADLDLKIDTDAEYGTLYLIDTAIAVSDSEAVVVDVGFSDEYGYKRRVLIEGEIASDTHKRFVLSTPAALTAFEKNHYSATALPPRAPMPTDTVMLEGAEISGGGAGAATFSWLNPFFHSVNYDLDGDHRVDATARYETVEGRVDTGELISLQHVMADGRFDTPDGSGTHTNLLAGETITLDGRMSVSPRGTALTYSWELLQRPRESLATIVDAPLPQAELLPDVAGRYIVKLTVTDAMESDSAIYPFDVDATESYFGASEAMRAQRTRVSSNGDAMLDYRMRKVRVDKGVSVELVKRRLSFLWPQGEISGFQLGGVDRVSGAYLAGVYQSTGPAGVPRFTAPILIEARTGAVTAKYFGLGDFNGDGTLDLGRIERSADGNAIHVTLRFPGGGLAEGAVLSVGNSDQFEFADMDNDGRTDLLLYEAMQVHILWRSAAGTFDFADKMSLARPWDSTIRVATEPGNVRPSIFRASRAEGALTISVLRPDGSRGFQLPVEQIVAVPALHITEGAFFSDIDQDGDLDYVDVRRRTNWSEIPGVTSFRQLGLSFAMAEEAGYVSSPDIAWLPRQTAVRVHINGWSDGLATKDGDYAMLLQTVSYKKIDTAAGWDELYSGGSVEVRDDMLAVESASDSTMDLMTVIPAMPGSNELLPFLCLPVGDDMAVVAAGLAAFGSRVYGSFPCKRAEDMLLRTFREDIDGNGWDDILLADGRVIFRFPPLGTGPT